MINVRSDQYLSVFVPLSLIFVAFTMFSACNAEWESEYIIDDKTLVPESVAYSNTTGYMYLSSIAQQKIIRLNPLGSRQYDFIQSGEYAYMPGLGLGIDDKTGRLYALGGHYRRGNSESALYIFDLRQKAMISYHSVLDTSNSFLNDLCLDKLGNAYITNTSLSSIYFYDQQADTLSLFLRSDEISFPNGICMSDDESILYVASHNKGIRTIDLQSRQILNSRDSTELTRGIDGLKYHEGNLFAVQNGSRLNSYNFRKLELDDKETDVVSAEVIWISHDRSEVPLNFSIHDGKALFIVNSNIQYLDKDNMSFKWPVDSIPHTKLKLINLETLE